MNEPLRLEYTCTSAEQSEAEELLILEQVGASKSSKLMSKAILFTLLILMMIGQYFKIYQIWPGHPILCAVAELLAFAIVYVIISRKSPNRRPTSQIELSTVSMRINNSNGQGSVSWNAFNKVWETENLILLRHIDGVVYVFPQRIFPDEESLEWFRGKSNAVISGSSSEEIMPAHTPIGLAGPDDIVLQFRISYRDYMDRTLCSWRLRGMYLLILVIFGGSFLSAALNPQPGAIFSPVQVFLYFLLPFLVFSAVFGFFIFTTHDWFKHRQAITTQTVIVAEKGFMCESSMGHVAYSWDQPTSFKETRWSFLLWHPDTRFWLLLPKRAFKSSDSIDACRKILGSRAKRSTWFF